MIKFIMDMWPVWMVVGGFVVVGFMASIFLRFAVEHDAKPENCHPMVLQHGWCNNSAHRFEIRDGVPLCLCPDPSPASGKVTG